MKLKDPQNNNSAGRLLAMLASIPPDRSLLDTLPTLAGRQAESMADRQEAAYSLLAELQDLYRELLTDMKECTAPEPTVQKLLAKLAGLREKVFPVHLAGGARALSDEERTVLEVCATLIGEEVPITEDDITVIRDSIARLRSQCERAEISPTLRKALLELIRLSEDAISRFRTRGAKGLKRAFKQMLGEAMDLYGREGEEERKSTVWSVVFGHLKTFDDVASRLLKYKPLLEQLTYLLLPVASAGS